MARLQLNKSSLARQSAELRTYKRFLPSLDLKRRQLMAERAKAARAVTEAQAAIREFQDQVGAQLPMLANTDIDLTDLVKLKKIDMGTENVVGTHLPVLNQIVVEVKPYALLAKPHWVDRAAAMLHDMMELQVREQIAKRRLVLLDKAVSTVTQRVNLFDKVLIPTTEANIKKIRIYLSDQEMASVVRSKIAKRKHAELARV